MDLIISTIRVFVIFFMVLSFVPAMIWMERKGSAYIQDRRGPNRASIFGIRLGGLIHGLADAIKLLTKEELAAKPVSKPLFYLAPCIALLTALLTMAIIPFADPINIFGYNISFQIADLNAGLVYVFAISSLGVYATLIAGWASAGKYPLLGSLRAAAQMISYELSMSLAIIALFILAGSLNLQDIVSDQGTLVWRWNIIRQPLAFIIFITALFAETYRLPFDMPEGESEIVAGYHTEYSSMRFASFFMAEYTHIIISSFIVAIVFLGGWHMPFVSPAFILKNSNSIIHMLFPISGSLLMIIGAALINFSIKKYNDLREYESKIIGSVIMLLGVAIIILWAWLNSRGYLINIPSSTGVILLCATQVITLLVKAFCVSTLFIWVRWTLPRFRYDQLMKLGWKVLLPLGILNIIITSAIITFS